MIQEPAQLAVDQTPRGPTGEGFTARRPAPAIIVLCLWIAVAVVYWPSTWTLGRLWLNAGTETYTHGFAILLISLWLVLRERRRLAACPIRPVPEALIALLLLSALWTWAWSAAIQELHVMLEPLILFIAILSVLGVRAASLLAFPVGYLYFALPFWSDFNGVLQLLSARMTGVLLWISGIPGFMENNFIVLPAGTIQIAGGCSGLHAFIVGLALAALYIKLFDLSGRQRVFALALMTALALIVNWLRIFVVAAAAYATAMQSSLVRNHYWLGWWLFAAGFAVFLWCMERKPATGSTHASIAVRNQLDSTEHVRPPGSAGSSWLRAFSVVVSLGVALLLLVIFATGLQSSLARNHYWLGWLLCAAALATFLWWARSNRVTHKSLEMHAARKDPAPPAPSSGAVIGPLAAALVALSVLPAAAFGMDWIHDGRSAKVTVHWPAAPPGWQGPTAALARKWHPYFVGSSAESLQAYTDSSGQLVQVFAVAYRVQNQRAKLLGYWNHLLGKTNMLHPDGRRIIDTASGHWIETQAVDRSGARSLIWSRYRIGSRVFVNPRLSQVWYGLAALINPPLSSLTAMRAKCEPNCRAARKQLKALSHVVRPQFLSAP